MKKGKIKEEANNSFKLVKTNATSNSNLGQSSVSVTNSNSNLNNRNKYEKTHRKIDHNLTPISVNSTTS